MSNLVKKVQNTIFQHKLFDRGAKIILAVSGGPDSVTMLRIFSVLQKKYGLELAIAHVNYGLRGRDSDKDEELVRKLAEKYGMEIFVLRPVETHCNASLRERKNIFSENELRDIRYSFFEKIRKENGFDAIAVAHNMDDQVETFFMRVIRGSGLQGMAAMKYKNGRIIRPLLSTPRKEILEYLKSNNLAYRTDKTNLESKYLRNKIRNKLLPYLEKQFNPQIKATVFGAIESIADDYSLISKIAGRACKKHKDLKVSELEKLPPAIRKRVIIEALADKKPKNGDIEVAHVNEIMKILSSTKGKRQEFSFKGLKVVRVGDKLEIEMIK